MSALDWLLEDGGPAGRYLAHRDLLPKPTSAAKLKRMRAQVLDWAPVKALLACQEDDGRFPTARDRARPDSAATMHMLGLLARCGLDSSVPQLAKAWEFVTDGYVLEGAFSTGGRSGILPCYVGQFAVVAADLARPEDGAGSTDWLVRYNRIHYRGMDEAEEITWPLRTPVSYGCWGDNVSCYHGVVSQLRALARTPAAERTPVGRARLDRCVDYLRVHRAWRKSQVDKPLFRHLLQFFLFGGYRFHLIDVLQGLAWADPALIEESWVSEAMEVVAARAPDDRITLVRNYDTHVLDPLPLGDVGAPNPLLTAQWLGVRRAFGWV